MSYRLMLIYANPCRFAHDSDELGAEEYTETKQETLEQMREFQASLTKLSAGDLSLTDYLASIQLVKYFTAQQ